MKEIGGFIELEHYFGAHYHRGCLRFNSARNALRFLIRRKGIKKILLPRWNCISIVNACIEEDVIIEYYSISKSFLPLLDSCSIDNDTYIYIINFYGQIEEEYVCELNKKYNIILDNVQAFFNKQMNGVDTIYSCRKYFGVPDGAYLYTDVSLNEQYEKEEAYKRIDFLLGRFERNANEFYAKYIENEKYLDKTSIKDMSLYSDNILKSIDYSKIIRIREDNYSYLDEQLGDINLLKLKLPIGPYMYPFMVNKGEKFRKEAHTLGIYIPVLWPNVLNDLKKDEVEYSMSNDILPLPIDQRYTIEDMKYVVNFIKSIKE